MVPDAFQKLLINLCRRNLPSPDNSASQRNMKNVFLRCGDKEEPCDLSAGEKSWRWPDSAVLRLTGKMTMTRGTAAFIATASITKP